MALASKKSGKKVMVNTVKKGKKPAAKSVNRDTVSSKAAADKQTKTQIVASISEKTGLTKKEVLSVFESMKQLIVAHMKKRGSGEFTIPEAAIRIKRKTRPASKSRMGRNPATGEPIKIAAKPARTVIKIIPLRALKETVSH